MPLVVEDGSYNGEFFQPGRKSKDFGSELHKETVATANLTGGKVKPERLNVRVQSDWKTPSDGDVSLAVDGLEERVGGVMKKRSVVVFETLEAALRSEVVAVDTVVELRERTAGSGGGSSWDVVASDGVVANGLDIVKCINDPMLSLVLRVENNSVRVSQLGAISDPVFDSSAAIQRATEIARHIVVDGATYYVATTVVLDPDTHLEGVGGGGIMPANLLSSMIETKNHSNITISGLRLSTNGTDSRVVRSDPDATTKNCLLKECDFEFRGGTAVFHAGGGNRTENMVVDSCTFVGNKQATAVHYDFGGFNGTRSDLPLIVKNCRFSKCFSSLRTAGTGFIYNTRFVDNVVLDSGDYPVSLYHNVDGVCDGNLFDGYEKPAWFDNRCNVNNNVFQNSKSDGVIIYNQTLTFNNNTVTQNAGNGLVMSVYLRHVIVSGNNIVKNGLNGIRISAEPRGTSWTPASVIFSAMINNNSILINGDHGILIDDIQKDGAYGNAVGAYSINTNMICGNGVNDDAVTRYSCGIYMKFHAAFATTTRFEICGNNIGGSWTGHLEGGQQYNAVIVDSLDEGGQLDVNVSNNRLLGASSSDVAYRDVRGLGKKNIMNNLCRGVVSTGQGGIINMQGNSFYDEHNTVTSQNGSRIAFRSGPPTSGTWKRGDRVENSWPSSGKHAGWMCVADGTPGTWKGYGLIE